MAERFNIYLPPRFQFKAETDEERRKELEEYLAKLTKAIEEMTRRMWNRLKAE